MVTQKLLLMIIYRRGIRLSDDANIHLIAVNNYEKKKYNKS